MTLPDRIRETAPGVLSRLLFALLSTAVVVVFSEKMYWYVTGYGLADLLVGYFLPTFAFLTIVDFFRVRRLAPLFLVAAVFGFLVEGVIVGKIYEGGPFSWFNLAYTPLAWHAPLSIVFGWYLLRRWLVAGQTRALLLGCAVVGLFWGVWALAWWLPENAADPQLLAAGARLGRWTVGEFAAHAFVFTTVLVVAHGLLGHRGWQPRFRPSSAELILLMAGLLFFFIFQVLLATWWAPLTLGMVLAAAFLPLAVNRRREPVGSLLIALAGPARARDLAAVYALPAVAVGVYALATAVQPSTDILYALTTFGQVLGSAFAGAVAFLLAIVLTLRPLGSFKLDPQQGG